MYAREAVLAGTDILEHAAGVSYSVVRDPSKWKGWGEIELASLDPRPFADMDDKKAAELIALMVKQHTYLEPDLVAQGRGLQRQRAEWAIADYGLLSNPDLAYIPAGVRHKWLSNHVEFDEWAPADREQLRKGFANMQQFIGRFVRAGGKVMAGTDTGPVGWAVSGIGLHREMELFGEAGLTPMQAITAATKNTAEGYRVLDRLGTAEAGKLADLVVVNADPLQDIRNTQNIEWVIQDGKVADRTYNRAFEDPFPRGAGGVKGRDWAAALKQVTERGIREASGLDDPTWAFGQPCPAIDSISPTTVTEGDQAATVTILGFNFTSKSVVYFAGRSVPVHLVSATELQATIGADLISRARTIPIRVENPGPFLAQPGWGSVSNTAQLVVNFRY